MPQSRRRSQRSLGWGPAPIHEQVVGTMFRSHFSRLSSQHDLWKCKRRNILSCSRRVHAAVAHFSTTAVAVALLQLACRSRSATATPEERIDDTRQVRCDRRQHIIRNWHASRRDLLHTQASFVTTPVPEQAVPAWLHSGRLPDR